MSNFGPLTAEDIARASVSIAIAIGPPPKPIYVITAGTSDYRDKVVLRRHVFKGTELVADFKPLAVAGTAEEVRAFLPPGLKRGPLTGGDDPVILEWWA